MLLLVIIKVLGRLKKGKGGYHMEKNSSNGSGNCIFRKKDFIVLAVGHEYIVVNREKIFKDGHTHLQSFKQAMYIVNMALSKRLPKHLSAYLLTSLIRVSDDEDYKQKIQELLDTKQDKRRGNAGYHNVAACCR